MANTSTRPGTDRLPLISYLRVQRDRDREMLAALSRSADRINSELRLLEARTTIGAAVRRDQLAATQVAIYQEISRLWRVLGMTIQAGRADAAAAAVQGMYPLAFLRRVMPAGDVDYLIRSAEAAARATADTLDARLGLSRIPLAESVYRSEDLVHGRVDDIVNTALARGASAAELAKDVRSFIRPDVRGGIRYAAMRLGRTELNNAFHAQQVQSAIDTPWTTGLKWNLSGSHPRPDECNEYADNPHFDGGPEGVYLPDEVPAKPHPNCLCFMTAETVSRELFVAKFNAGDYDTIVDRLIGSGSMTFR